MEEFYEDCQCEACQSVGVMVSLSNHERGVTLAAPGDGAEMPDYLKAFLKAIHRGDVQSGQIDAGYYAAVTKDLLSGAAEGLGGKTFGAADYRNTLKAFLDENIYAFSSARSLYMLEQYRSFLTDAEGNVLSEAQFISKVTNIADVDSLVYLKTERNSAIASAQMAEKWQGLQAFPALEYRTMEDNRVRPEHAILEGLVLATDNPRWSTIYPPNGWNCRCTVLPAAGDAVPIPDKEATNLVKAADIPDYFKRNVGKERLIYSDDHPYIESVGVKALAKLDAVDNYGLRSVDRIYKTADLPTYTPTEHQAVADAWWHDQAGSAAASFDLKAVDDIAVTFNKAFKDETDFSILKQAKAVLQHPDEVWAIRNNGVIETRYIKYFDGLPMVLETEAGKAVNAKALYHASLKDVAALRKGILKVKHG